MQHDVQEMEAKLCEKLEEKMKVGGQHGYAIWCDLGQELGTVEQHYLLHTHP